MAQTATTAKFPLLNSWPYGDMGGVPGKALWTLTFCAIAAYSPCSLQPGRKRIGDVVPVALAALLVLCVAITGYGKLTLLHQYRVEEYLATARASRLYWSVRIAAAGLAASIAGLSLCTRIWWVELPAMVFAAFILYVNSRAVFLRLSGKYIEYYRQRGWR